MNFKANFQKNMSKKGLIDLLYGVLGGVIYSALPTAVGVDGYTGLATGVGSSILAGALLDKPAIGAGAVGASIAHIWWSKNLSETILKEGQWMIYPDTQQFQQGPDGTVTQIADGTETIMVDGSPVVVSKNPAVQPNALAGYYQGSNATLAGYYQGEKYSQVSDQMTTEEQLYAMQNL